MGRTVPLLISFWESLNLPSCFPSQGFLFRDRDAAHLLEGLHSKHEALCLATAPHTQQKCLVVSVKIVLNVLYCILYTICVASGTFVCAQLIGTCSLRGWLPSVLRMEM